MCMNTAKMHQRNVYIDRATRIAGDMALLEQVKQLIPRLTYQQIQDNPFAEGATADVSEDAQDIVPLVVDAIVGFCQAQLCDFTAAFPHGTRMMKGAVEVMRIGLHSRGDPTGLAQVPGCIALRHKHLSSMMCLRNARPCWSAHAKMLRGMGAAHTACHSGVHLSTSAD